MKPFSFSSIVLVLETAQLVRRVEIIKVDEMSLAYLSRAVPLKIWTKGASGQRMDWKFCGNTVERWKLGC
jgi:hypothetical protein